MFAFSEHFSIRSFLDCIAFTGSLGAFLSERGMCGLFEVIVPRDCRNQRDARHCDTVPSRDLTSRDVR